MFRHHTNCQTVARQLGRKKVRKERSKAYREIFRLRVALKREETLKETMQDAKGIVNITKDQKKKMLLLKGMTAEK